LPPRKNELRTLFACRNGDGQIEIDEVCAAIDQVIEAERHERVFKWLAILAAIVAVLAVAASAGLTYAVVALTKDVQVDNNNLLVSKSSGEALQTQNSDFLVSDSGALLNRQGTGAVGKSLHTLVSRTNLSVYNTYFYMRSTSIKTTTFQARSALKYSIHMISFTTPTHPIHYTPGLTLGSILSLIKNTLFSRHQQCVRGFDNG